MRTDRITVINRLEQVGFDLARWSKADLQRTALEAMAAHAERVERLRQRLRPSQFTPPASAGDWLPAIAASYGARLVPIVETTWGFIACRKEKAGKSGAYCLRLNFYSLVAAAALPMGLCKQSFAKAVRAELKAVWLSHAGIEVGQGDPHALGELFIRCGDAEEATEKESSLVDFMTVLFVQGRCDDLVSDCLSEVERLITTFAR